MRQKKRYEVNVTETLFVWGVVEVEAFTQEEAQELARADFQIDWSNYDILESDTENMTENGQAMIWSDEASNVDPENPYVKDPEFSSNK